MTLPMPQSKAPEFSCTALLPNKEFKELSLTDFLGKWVVLFFYPLDFTFVCPTEIIAFGDRQAEFAAINTQVIAASCDSEYTHLAWVSTPRTEGGLGDMQIPILADFSKQIATDYGCLLPDGIPLRALYIIDPKGVVRQVTVNDLPVGRNVDEVLRLLQAFQFTDIHGEVCPANWQPGDLTMKDDPAKSKSYFQTVNSTNDNSIVKDVEDLDEFRALISKGTVIADYWAPWCQKCKKMTPLISKLAQEFSGAKFLQVNTDAAVEIGNEMNVMNLPTLHFFKDGVKIEEFTGSDLAKAEATVRRILN